VTERWHTNHNNGDYKIETHINARGETIRQETEDDHDDKSNNLVFHKKYDRHGDLVYREDEITTFGKNPIMVNHTVKFVWQAHNGERTDDRGVFKSSNFIGKDHLWHHTYEENRHFKDSTGRYHDIVSTTTDVTSKDGDRREQTEKKTETVETVQEDGSTSTSTTTTTTTTTTVHLKDGGRVETEKKIETIHQEDGSALITSTTTKTTFDPDGNVEKSEKVYNDPLKHTSNDADADDDRLASAATSSAELKSWLASDHNADTAAAFLLEKVVAGHDEAVSAKLLDNDEDVGATHWSDGVAANTHEGDTSPTHWDHEAAAGDDQDAAAGDDQDATAHWDDGAATNSHEGDASATHWDHEAAANHHGGGSGDSASTGDDLDFQDA
jgi:hypothetical protein